MRFELNLRKFNLQFDFLKAVVDKIEIFGDFNCLELDFAKVHLVQIVEKILFSIEKFLSSNTHFFLKKSVS